MSAQAKISSAALEKALAIAGVGCWVWQPNQENGQRLQVSDDFHLLLGCSSEMLPNSEEAWLARAHPDDQESLSHLFTNITNIDCWDCGNTTLRLRNESGAWSWFDVKARRQSDQIDSNVIITFNDITQQKQTEAALRDSQLRYRALYSTAPLAFILWNRQGQITEWNRRAESMFGWQSQEVIGKPVHHLLLPAEQLDTFRAAIKQLTHGSSNADFTGPALGKDGLLLHCTWYNVALRSPQGGLIGILSLVLDITEEMLAQQRLQKSEKIYRTLVETSPDAILLLTLEGRLTMANQQAQRLFGLDELDDINATNIRDLLPATGEDAAARNFLDHPDEFSGFIANRDLRMCDVDGCAFDVSSAFTTIIDSHGQPNGIVFFARDVTEKLQAARELDEHRRNLEQLVQDRTRELEFAHDSLSKIIDGSPVPTFVLNANHEITHWNKACESVIGTSATQMIGSKNQWKGFYDSPRPVMADLVMTGEMQQIEQLYQSKYRRSQLVPDAFEAEDYFPLFKRWLFFTATPLRNPQGKIIGAIETLQDISERKKAEIALFDAKSIAELAAKSKAEFLANMSHEIGTPMNAVIGLGHLLLKTDLSRKQHDYVSRIQGAGEILLRLINDVLDFSKIEAGRMQLEATDFSLDSVLTNVATVVLTRAQEKGLELHYVVEPDVPAHLIGDPLRLTQILVNLLGNAIKFTAKGTVTAFFRKANSESGEFILEVDVQDTGIGMTLEQQSMLFQAFTQADTSITRNYGGTGLGLTISKRLVELMHGKIWVTSQANIGSTFSFQVQLGTLDNAAEAAENQEQLKTRRALVVDDNPLARTVLMRLLEKFGCQTQAADSGDTALDLLQNPAAAPFDYITIDLNMPGMDGLTLASNIREALPISPKLVLVTAADTHAMEESGQLHQFDSVLNKPITAAQIRELLTGTPALGKPLLSKAPAALQGLRILLAEDIPTNQLIATEMLQAFGITVDVVDNGRLAVEAIAQHSNRFDLILMDMQMPEMDGLEATRRIRSQFPGLQLPIIAMTAHALDEERARCMAAGMNDFITKPVDPAILEATLLRWKPTIAPVPEPSPSRPEAMPATTSPDPFPNLPGIDIENGMRRMMNKRSLYERVLRDFNKRFAGEAALIRAALHANDLPTAERHAHSTKGLSGSIGALDLQAASLNLEAAIRAGNGYPESALATYENALKIVIDGITQAFPEN